MKKRSDRPFHRPVQFQQKLNLFNFGDFPQKLFQKQYADMEKVRTIRETRKLRSGEKHPNLIIPRPNSLVVDIGLPNKVIKHQMN